MSPTADRNYMPIVFADTRLGAYNATWAPAAGTLTFDVLEILQQSGLQYLSDLSMSFVVVNKATDQNSPSISVTHTIRNVVAEGGQ